MIKKSLVFVALSSFLAQSALADISGNLSKVPGIATAEVGMATRDGIRIIGPTFLPTVFAGAILAGGIKTTDASTRALSGEQLRQFLNDPAAKELVAFIGGSDAQVGEKYRLAAQTIAEYREKVVGSEPLSDQEVARQILMGLAGSVSAK